VKVELTAKLTTERLDVLARRWTMYRQKPRIQDDSRRGWMILDGAARALQPRGADAIFVPPALGA
jgi:hypothetical protein